MRTSAAGAAARRRRDRHDRHDLAVPAQPRSAPTGAALLLHGLFLRRPEHADCFELSFFLDVPVEAGLARGALRDPAATAASESAVAGRDSGGYLAAYRPGRRAAWRLR